MVKINYKRKKRSERKMWDYVTLSAWWQTFATVGKHAAKVHITCSLKLSTAEGRLTLNLLYPCCVFLQNKMIRHLWNKHKGCCRNPKTTELMQTKESVGIYFKSCPKPHSLKFIIWQWFYLHQSVSQKKLHLSSMQSVFIVFDIPSQKKAQV